MKIQHWLVTLLFMALGLGVFAYKATVLNISLLPNFKSSKTLVEAHLVFSTTNAPATLSLFLPKNTSRYTLFDEQFISNGFALATEINNGNRLAHWSRVNGKKKFELFYRALVAPVSKKDKVSALAPIIPAEKKSKLTGKSLKRARKLIDVLGATSTKDKDLILSLLNECFHKKDPIKEAARFCAAESSETAKLKAIVQILAVKKIPAQVAHGITLEKPARHAKVVHWLEVYSSSIWQAFDQRSLKTELPEHYIKWWAGDAELLKAEGVEELELNLSVSRSESVGTNAAIKKAQKKSKKYGLLSLSELPVETQAVYHLVLLIPLGALLVAFMRNVIGINTLGTFTPVLIALSFRETGLIWGVVFYSLLVVLGLCFRFLFERLQLLLIPRLTASLTMVIILMLGISILTEHYDIQKGLSVALFPLVILTMTIERMSIVSEELGFFKALRLGGLSMLVAVLTYFVITNQHLEYWFFVFPEFLFVNLALAVMLGRYTGYRLLELRRFKSLVRK